MWVDPIFTAGTTKQWSLCKENKIARLETLLTDNNNNNNVDLASSNGVLSSAGGSPPSGGLTSSTATCSIAHLTSGSTSALAVGRRRGPSRDSPTPNQLYRIVLKTSISQVVAISNSIEDIHYNWGWIETNLIPQLDAFDLSEGASPEEIATMWQFVVLKFSSLARESVKKEEPLDDDEEIGLFQKMFGSHEDEGFVTCLASELCRGDIMRRGHVYITLGALYFHSAMLSTRIKIPWEEVTLISLKPFGDYRSAINIVTTEDIDSEFQITGMEDIEEAYGLMNQLWERVVDMALQELLLMTQPDPPRVAWQSGRPKIKDALSLSRTTSHAELKRKALELQRNCRNLITTFCLPPSEQFRTELLCRWHRDSKSSKGNLVITNNFLCFKSDSVDDIIVTLPLAEIKRVRKDLRRLSGFDLREHILMLDVGPYQFNFYSPNSVNTAYCLLTSYLETKHPNSIPSAGPTSSPTTSAARKFGASLLQALSPGSSFSVSDPHREATYNHSTPSIPILIPLDARLIPNSYQFIGVEEVVSNPSDYAAKQKAQLKKLLAYYKDDCVSCVSLKCKQLKKLITQGGIPDCMRGKLWQVWSGAANYFKSGEYEKLLRRAESSPDFSELVHDIDKDLHRSFPHHPFFNTDEGLASLRRILVAYATQSSSGYVQSMNLVCAYLRVFISEEETYWLFSTICEHMLPQHYISRPSMFGAVLRQKVLCDLLNEYQPTLYKHLYSLSVPINVIVVSWFTTLFIGRLSLESTLRVLDWFFYTGQVGLMQLGLAIFKINSKVILTTHDPVDISLVLKEELSQIDVDELLRVASTDFSEISRMKIEELWRKYKYATVEEIYKKSVVQDQPPMKLEPKPTPSPQPEHCQTGSDELSSEQSTSSLGVAAEKLKSFWNRKIKRAHTIPTSTPSSSQSSNVASQFHDDPLNTT